MPTFEEISQLLEETTTSAQRDALRTSIRVSIDFGKYLAGELEGRRDIQAVRTDVRQQIAQFLERVGVGVDVDLFLRAIGEPRRVDYANETTVSAMESFEVSEKNILELIGDSHEVCLRGWSAYSNVEDLRVEYEHHLSVLKNSQTELKTRLRALLDLERLQLIFLANTIQTPVV